MPLDTLVLPSLGAQIMWPRLDSGHLASVGGRKLGGFVAYLRRPDAERAAKEMDGVEWGDNIIKISWGKAVPVAARAMYGACAPCLDTRSVSRPVHRAVSGLTTSPSPQNLNPTRRITATRTTAVTARRGIDRALDLARAPVLRPTRKRSSDRGNADLVPPKEEEGAVVARLAVRAHGQSWRTGSRSSSWSRWRKKCATMARRLRRCCDSGKRRTRGLLSSWTNRFVSSHFLGVFVIGEGTDG